jgi:outer membrane protein TolC
MHDRDRCPIRFNRADVNHGTQSINAPWGQHSGITFRDQVRRSQVTYVGKDVFTALLTFQTGFFPFSVYTNRTVNKALNKTGRCFWRHLRVFGMFVMFVFLSGCYLYNPPPAPIEHDRFSDIAEVEQRTLPEGCERLDLELAVETAIKNNPDFISKYHSMKAAWARFYQSLSAYLPTITGTYGIGEDRTYPRHYSGPGLDPRKQYNYYNEIGIQGQWLVFDGLMRTMNMLSARQEAKYAESINEDARRLLIKAVADQFHSILLAQEQIRIDRANLSFNLRQTEESQIKYDAGSVALTDVLNFRIQATQAENSLIIAEYQLENAKFILAELMGLTSGYIPDDVTITAEDEVETQYLTDIGVYLDTALANRPDLQAFRQTLMATRYAYYSTWGALSPKVYFNTGYNYSWDRTRVRGSEPLNPVPSARNPYREKEYTGTFNYGMSINWELFSGGRRLFAIRELQATVAEREYQLEEQWLKVISEVRQAYDECQKSTRQLLLFRKIQDDALKNRDLVEEDYKAGNTDIIRLNEAQTQLVQAQSDLAKARINVLNSRTKLAAATGVN